MTGLLNSIVSELIQKYSCHTIILYGSHARGDATEESDYDLLAFTCEGKNIRDARLFHGKYLDAFIYLDSEIGKSDEQFLHARFGKILIEQNDLGKNLLHKLNEIFAAGPKQLPEDELQMRRIWIEKMLRRIQKGDIEGNFRRVWLQFDLLESYFNFRNLWYLGPKESLAWLAVNDPEAFKLYETVLKPFSSISDIEKLAKHVLTF